MTSTNINVRVPAELYQHLLQQMGGRGLYENASEYIRDLIRRDFKNKREAWEWLSKSLEPAMRADKSEYVKVSAAEIIARNKKCK